MPWALLTTASSPESWHVLTAPWLGKAGFSRSARSCAGVAEVVSFTSQVAEAQLQVSSATYPVFIRRGPPVLSESVEEEAEVPHCWWAWQLETVRLHSASLPSYLANHSRDHLDDQGLLPWELCSTHPKSPHCPCPSFWSGCL